MGEGGSRNPRQNTRLPSTECIQPASRWNPAGKKLSKVKGCIKVLQRGRSSGTYRERHMGPRYMTKRMGSATMDYVQGRDEVNQWQKSVRALRPGNQELQPPSEVRRNWMHQLQQGAWAHLRGPFLFFSSLASEHISCCQPHQWR